MNALRRSRAFWLGIGFGCAITAVGAGSVRWLAGSVFALALATITDWAGA